MLFRLGLGGPVKFVVSLIIFVKDCRFNGVHTPCNHIVIDINCCIGRKCSVYVYVLTRNSNLKSVIYEKNGKRHPNILNVTLGKKDMLYLYY